MNHHWAVYTDDSVQTLRVLALIQFSKRLKQIAVSFFPHYIFHLLEYIFTAMYQQLSAFLKVKLPNIMNSVFFALYFL